MSYLGKVFGASFLSLLVATFPVYTCSYAESDAAAPAPDSESLTQYLHSQRLPLVGAQVSASEGGGRDVVLYGFVAAELGSQHAEEHVRTFMHDSSIKIENRIKIRPEIASLKDPSKKRTTKKSP